MEHYGLHSSEQFTRLLVAHQRRIYGFIYTLVQDHVATEDILQEVTTVLWRKFETFELGSDFGSWALRVARLSVFEWRRLQQKLPLPIDDELLLKLASKAEAVQSSDHLARYETLEDCLSHLHDRDRELLNQRYVEDEPVTGIASRSGRTRDAVYKVLARIHRNLGECIQHKLEGLHTS
jgi:RNA polymerase sigma-70 factor (ECF subfamily)